MKKTKDSKKEGQRNALNSVHDAASLESAGTSNTVLMAYIQEYMRDPAKDTYKMLEEESVYTERKDTQKIDACAYLAQKRQSVYSCLVSALIDTEEIVYEAQEEEKKKKLHVRSDVCTEINDQLSAMLCGTLITDKDIESMACTEKDKTKQYEEMLNTVIRTNNKNKRIIRDRRKTHFAQIVYASLVESIDAEIEAVYMKKCRAKKKKKEEDSTHYTELEELLDKREKVKKMCKDIPESLIEMDNTEMGIEDVLAGLSKEEKEEAQNMMPAGFRSCWL